MWLITGPFDSETTGDEETQKTKLLRAKTTYGVSRYKEYPLYINHKKISRLNGEFIVGDHSEDDISNAALVPTISFRNNKTTAVKVERQDEHFLINPNSIRELETDDIIRFTSNISVRVHWAPKICYHSQTDLLPTFDRSVCASLGIKLVTKHSRDVTHHLMSTLSAPLPSHVFYSLMTPSIFVTPEWIVDLIQRAPDLEKTYELPLEKHFRPTLDASFIEQHPSMGKSIAWDPKEDRKALFDGMKFAFIVFGSGAGSLSKAMTDVVSRGGAERQLVDIEKEADPLAQGTAGSWAAVLKKKSVVQKEGMRSGVVLVGEEDTMTARGIPKGVKSTWQTMVEKARSVDLRIIHPSLIAEAIFKADLSVLDCVVEGKPRTEPAHSLPDHIPSTHPEEPSQAPPPPASQTISTGSSRRLTRRATSQTPAPEPPAVPALAPMEVEGAALRKPLKRRAKIGAGGLLKEILGTDDSVVVLDGSESQSRPQQIEKAQPIITSVPATPGRASRLKRRAGTQATASQLLSEPESVPEDTGEEPPLKKFKALFEESGHGGVDRLDGGISEGISADNHLMAAIEEDVEEEYQNRPQASTRITDQVEEFGNADVDVNMHGTGKSMTHKRHANEAINAIEPSHHGKPPSRANSVSATTIGGETKKAKGALPGKPDTDISFMRAITSTKQGKKAEDEFDREFNKLRIAKPNVKQSRNETDVNWEQTWSGLDDFERDVGIRGNFMQILEMEVWRDTHQRACQPGQNIRRESGLGARMDWNGREDFKKFRRKVNVQPKAQIQVIVSEPPNSGLAHWGSKNTQGVSGFSDEQSQSQDQFSQLRFTQTQNAPKSHSKPPSRSMPRPRFGQPDEDEEVEDELSHSALPKGKGKTSIATKGRVPRSAKQKPALFEMGSEDEDESPNLNLGAGETLSEGEDVTSTLPSTTKTTRTQRGAKRKAVAVVEDSGSDDGMTLGGFAKKKKGNVKW